MTNEIPASSSSSFGAAERPVYEPVGPRTVRSALSSPSVSTILSFALVLALAPALALGYRDTAHVLGHWRGLRRGKLRLIQTNLPEADPPAPVGDCVHELESQEAEVEAEPDSEIQGSEAE